MVGTHGPGDRFRQWLAIAAAVGMALAVAGCSLAPVRLVNTLRGRWVDSVSLKDYPDRVSPQAAAAMHEAGLRREEWRDAEAGTLRLASNPSWRRSAALCLAESELAIRAAMETPPRLPDRSLAWLFWSAEAAATGLGQARTGSAVEKRLTEVYNEAAMRATLDWYRRRPKSVAVHGRSWQPVMRISAGEFYPGMSFDTLEAAAGLRQRGLRHHYTVDGIGAAFVASRDNAGKTPLERFLPEEGIFYPATSVLRFDSRRKSGGPVAIEILDPDHTASVDFAGRKRMLAADFTMPQAALLSRSGDLKLLEIVGAFRPGSTDRRAALHLMQPYDPDRIPLVMIHGLLASQLTWRQVTNEIRGNPELRRRYQIWHFYYPTGLPALRSAADLRNNLRNLRRTLDPEGDDFASRNMVVLGHSMGGLLAHTLVSDSGTILWDSMVSVTPDHIHASPEALATLRASLLFERKPFVKRVIFVAVPHRGSSLATGWLSRLARRIIAIPTSILETQAELLTGNPGVWSDSAVGFLSGRTASSVDSLKPGSITTTSLAALPIPVPVHSIIGQRRPGPKESGSDGIVPWTSSHFPGAVSELVVEPANHGVHNAPEAIAEVKRVLALPLGKSGK